MLSVLNQTIRTTAHGTVDVMWLFLLSANCMGADITPPPKKKTTKLLCFDSQEVLNESYVYFCGCSWQMTTVLQPKLSIVIFITAELYDEGFRGIILFSACAEFAALLGRNVYFTCLEGSFLHRCFLVPLLSHVRICKQTQGKQSDSLHISQRHTAVLHTFRELPVLFPCNKNGLS